MQIKSHFNTSADYTKEAELTRKANPLIRALEELQNLPGSRFRYDIMYLRSEGCLSLGTTMRGEAGPSTYYQFGPSRIRIHVTEKGITLENGDVTEKDITTPEQMIAFIKNKAISAGLINPNAPPETPAEPSLLKKMGLL